MKKIVKLNNCSDCPHHEINTFREEECWFFDIEKSLEEVEMVDGFPEWCPLDDELEKENLEVKHTPGPWEANGRFLQVPALNWRHLAEFNSPIHDIPTNDEEYEANKRLIEQSPKLYELCRETKYLLDNYRRSMPADFKVNQLREQLNEVFAKIEGDVE